MAHKVDPERVRSMAAIASETRMEKGRPVQIHDNVYITGAN
jgi:hypothetical protein